MVVAYHLNILDFDGDELNVTLLLDELMENEFKTLAPYYNIPDSDKPYSIGNNLTLLSPANSIISNAISDIRHNPDLDTIFAKLRKV